MILRTGYEKSSCDCMECSILENDFPFMARTYQLQDAKMGLDSRLKPDLMFLAWFVNLSGQHQKIRLCPDILYITCSAEIGMKIFRKNIIKYLQKY